MCGNSGAGKSTVCERLRRQGHAAVDTDWEGYSHWADRISGQVVTDPPYPAPPGWLHRYGWRMSRAKVEALASRAAATTVFLCGSAENMDEVQDLFDLTIRLVIDERTLIDRLANRTTNTFGAHPEELAAAVEANRSADAADGGPDAVVIDGTQPVAAVVEAVLAAAGANAGR